MASSIFSSARTSYCSHTVPIIPYEQYLLFASIKVNLDTIPHYSKFTPKDLDPSSEMRTSFIFSPQYPNTIFMRIHQNPFVDSTLLEDDIEEMPMRISRRDKRTSFYDTLIRESGSRPKTPIVSKKHSISKGCPITPPISPRVLSGAIPHFSLDAPGYGFAKIKFRPTEKILIFEVTFSDGLIEYMDMAQAEALLHSLQSSDGYRNPLTPSRTWHLL